MHELLFHLYCTFRVGHGEGAQVELLGRVVVVIVGVGEGGGSLEMVVLGTPEGLGGDYSKVEGD
jgi:hypothetical protein